MRVTDKRANSRADRRRTDTSDHSCLIRSAATYRNSYRREGGRGGISMTIWKSTVNIRPGRAHALGDRWQVVHDVVGRVVVLRLEQRRHVGRLVGPRTEDGLGHV